MAQTAMKDPYQILGVSKTASQDEIKNAYRALAKKYHPDLNPGNKEAENKFKDISHAYELVGTPEARAKYERGEFEQVPPGFDGFAGFGKRGRPGGGGAGPFYYQTQEGPAGQAGRYSFSFGGEGFDEDIFESIFGGLGGAGMGGGRRSARGASSQGFPGQDVLYQMEVDLRDAVRGAEREITLPTGKRLAVKIPAGVTDGTKLRFAGLGEPGLNGGPAGDAFIEIRVREDARFKRQGDHLIMELPISLSEALFGGEVRVPTIDGEVMLKIPPRSNTDQKMKLSGKGVYNRSTKRRGDQIVVLKVMLPKKPDPELEEALKRWSERHHYDPRATTGSYEKGAA